jgi:hypothetical protein
VEYALRINHAGRSLLIQDSKNNDDRSIPVSVWPIVLKRVDVFPKMKNEIDFTGIYYLIRMGPAVANRQSINVVVRKKAKTT